jgi:F-box interacting protein
LCEPYQNPSVVCNPVTGEFIRLPKVIDGSRITMCSGIGFQTKTNEYKVVRIVYGSSKVEINVVGTPTWRKVRVDGNCSVKLLSYPTFVNEALHWICYPGENYNSYSILRFNFETEKLQLIGLPSTLLGHYGIRKGVLRDSLYVCNASLPSLSRCVDYEE